MPRAAKNIKDAPKNNEMDLWLKKAHAIERTDNPLKVPYEIAIEEAIALSQFITMYWEPSGERPGLKSVKSRLPAETAAELLSLVRAIHEAQTRFLLIVDPVVVELGQIARAVADDLESALEFLLDADVEVDADDPVPRRSQDGQRSSVLAQSLRDYAALARAVQDRLIVLDHAFDPYVIEQAERLAHALAQPPPLPAQEDSRTARGTRNRLLHLLVQRMHLVRRTAAHVFRRHPEILREAMSAYERRRMIAAHRDRLRVLPSPDRGAAPA